MQPHPLLRSRDAAGCAAEDCAGRTSECKRKQRKAQAGGSLRLLRICIEMDEVLADTLSEHLRRYNEAFDEHLVTGDLWGKGLWDVVANDRQTQLRAFLDADD